MNETLLVLIPKVEQPENLREFRPISLCDVIYKIITKIIANRIKGILDEIIGPHQCSFIKGRHITNNIIVASEAIHTMKS